MELLTIILKSINTHDGGFNVEIYSKINTSKNIKLLLKLIKEEHDNVCCETYIECPNGDNYDCECYDKNNNKTHILISCKNNCLNNISKIFKKTECKF
jgi:hypothetical protein